MRCWLLMLALACGSNGQEHPEARDDREADDGSESVEEPAEVIEPGAEVAEPEPEVSEADPESTEAEPESPLQASAPSTEEPSVFTRVMFDLRGMPHRGPRDVDPEMIRMRTELLMQRMREAAGSPEPRLSYHPGVSTFRAEFFGSRADALAQCRRAVRQVAPPIDRSKLSPRAALSEPKATPCAPID